MTRPPHVSEWIDLDRTLDRSPAAMYLARVGKGSRRTLHQSLSSLAAMLAGEGADPVKLRWEALRREHTVALREQLKETFAPATANKMLSALRGVLRAARSMGLMEEGDFQAAASLEMVKAADPAPVRPVTPQTLAALFDACANDPGVAGRRDAALLAIFLSSGLRRAEAAALDMTDYDPASGSLHIRGERPEHDRLVTLPSPARRALADWLFVRTTKPGPLLLPVDRGGIIRFRHMTDQAIYDIFGRIMDRAGAREVTLRDLRRAYVMGLIRAGKPLKDVQYLVGHASWFTTATYEALIKDTAIQGYDLARLPYREPKTTVSRPPLPNTGDGRNP